ncbi:uncharacterized protein MONOS_8430 [Monocercomonoides exilis]|uniref:uncharacterized protein n=1 Tax=Monocercomonoides exilis TaxID=2049356 RepID=UPI003559DAB7|nr:hypothetical protein MONOS_8430 [Monocercomonoides exilis]|eukprot:MONOS_8430.1-p1 / transcript=MONOS_8430.1 / gene=MONOS_8430 / organism=Monocercomonoides_exilis_PA203 / gene_product=unspecified product / transcript_product=unspecified product / location=Mono_scaffold00317:27631-27942(+) / protein_length=82 / sequence_SO=supercontig / SO=protein_coding / is_pseudo=false
MQSFAKLPVRFEIAFNLCALSSEFCIEERRKRGNAKRSGNGFSDFELHWRIFFYRTKTVSEQAYGSHQISSRAPKPHSTCV